MVISLEKLKSLQLSNGGLERFHSMSKTSPLTTEHALRKCMYSNISKDDFFCSRLLEYVLNLLHEREVFPDRIEKVMNWAVFTKLMYSAWLTIFHVKDDAVEEVIKQWKEIVEYATKEGMFAIAAYEQKFNCLFGKPKSTERYINPANFYVVQLLKQALSDGAKDGYFNYVMNRGIYYVYEGSLWTVPDRFDSNTTIHYCNAIRMVTPYCLDKKKLLFVREWILQHQDSSGYWETKCITKDGYILDGDWKRKDNKRTQLRNFFEDVLTMMEQ